MRYFSGMLVRLLETNDFIDERDRHTIKEEFDESFKKSQESTNPITRRLNAFLSHPLGVLMSLLLFVRVSKEVRQANMDSRAMTMQEEFEMEYKQQMFRSMIEDVKNKAA